MTPEETKNLQAAVGRFAIAFERMVNALVTGSVTILEANGLSPARLGVVMVDSLTADPLRKIFFSLFGEVRKELSDDATKIVKAINRQIQDAINTRNDVLHRTWFISEAFQSDKSGTAFGLKTKNTLQGVEPRPLNYTPEDFISHEQHFFRLEGQIFILLMAATEGIDITLSIKVAEDNKTDIIVQGGPDGNRPTLA